MTEAELAEHLMAWFAQISSDADRYFTLVSAYMVIAYLIGKQLSLLQLSIINALFLLWVGGIVAGTFSAVDATTIIQSKLLEIGSEFNAGQASTGLYNLMAIYVGGVIASLVFMWSVRHPKTT